MVDLLFIPHLYFSALFLQQSCGAQTQCLRVHNTALCTSGKNDLRKSVACRCLLVHQYTQMKARHGSPFGVRPDKDVSLLLEKALKAGGRFKNQNQIANIAMRSLLTPQFGTKLIRNLQEKLGVAA